MPLGGGTVSGAVSTDKLRSIASATSGGRVHDDEAEHKQALATRFDVDEVMVHPVASAHRGTDPATAPGRETTLELLAKELF